MIASDVVLSASAACNACGEPISPDDSYVVRQWSGQGKLLTHRACFNRKASDYEDALREHYRRKDEARKWRASELTRLRAQLAACRKIAADCRRNAADLSGDARAVLEMVAEALELELGAGS